MRRVNCLLAAVWVAGCGGSSPRAASPDDLRRHAVRLAVLPVAWATPTALVELDAGSSLLESVTVRGVEAIQPATEPRCATDSACARNAGLLAHADKVLTVQLAGLGATVLLRASLIDVASGTQEQTRQRVVTDATAASVLEAIVSLGREMVQPFEPAAPIPNETEWYEQWWIWTIAGVVVAGAITTVILLSSGASEPGPDVIIPLP